MATPLGPNHAMNALVAVSSQVPASATAIATGRASSSVKATIAAAATPSSNSPPNVSSEPNTTKIPSFTSSMMSCERLSKQARMSGRRMPSTIAHTNTAMKPFPSGGSTATP